MSQITGYWKWVVTYEKKPLTIDTADMLLYDTDMDAYSDMLEMLRGYFRGEFDATPYLYPDVILDYPIANFNEIEYKLLNGYF